MTVRPKGGEEAGEEGISLAFSFVISLLTTPLRKMEIFSPLSFLSLQKKSSFLSR